MPDAIIRRSFLKVALGAPAFVACQGRANAASFTGWVEKFRARALARGVSEATYREVMGAVKPDTSVYGLDRAQPEFTEKLWQYLNRRVSDWRISTGKERANEYAELLARIEREYAVDRYTMLGLWGNESAFGDVVSSRKKSVK